MIKSILIITAIIGTSLTLPKSNLENRITGGYLVEEKQFPFAAAIYMNGKYLCSGTLISNRWALTAGSCTKAAGENFLFVSVGGLTNIVQHETGRHDFPARLHWTHEYYDGGYEHNIGLIKMDYNIDLSQYILPIDLPKRGSSWPEVEALLMLGYKETALHFGAGVVMDKSECIAGGISEELLTENVICTNFKDVTSTCPEDVGAAYFLDKNAGTEYGILVHGGCGTEPSVYLKIEPYLNWIADITELYFP